MVVLWLICVDLLRFGDYGWVLRLWLCGELRFVGVCFTVIF